MSLSCCTLILLLFLLFILSLSLQLGTAAPSSLFAIFLTYVYNFSTLIYNSLTAICCVFILCGFSSILPFICPRHDKLTVVYHLLSKFNSFQMLEFDDSWKLNIIRIVSGIVPDEKPFSNFLSSFCFSIAPGYSNTSILIPLTSLSLFF